MSRYGYHEVFQSLGLPDNESRLYYMTVAIIRHIKCSSTSRFAQRSNIEVKVIRFILFHHIYKRDDGCYLVCILTSACNQSR